MAIIITGTQWGSEGKTKFSHIKSLKGATIVQSVREIEDLRRGENELKVVGILKAYATKIGKKEFPTEEQDEIGELIRKLGNEYDPITKEPRRCGWLDLMTVKRAIEEKGITELAISHFDTIGRIGQEVGSIKVCNHYLKDHLILKMPPENLKHCKPDYEIFYGGWEIGDCKTWDDLSGRAKSFIEHIERYVGVPVRYIGTGWKDHRVIIRP